MEDYRTLDNIIHEMKIIEDNIWDSMEHLNSIDMLLSSNDNGSSKDEDISEGYLYMRDKAQELIEAMNDFISMINDDEM